LRLNIRAILIGLILLVLAGGVVFAGLRFFGDDAERVLYLEPDDPGPDPFSDPAVLAADVTTTTTTTILAATPSPTPTGSPSPTATPGPLLTASPLASPSPTVTFAGSGRKGECDSELLIRLLNESPERKAAWLEVLGVEPQTFEADVRSLLPALLTRDVRITSHGFREGQAYEFHAILARGTAVLVGEEGELIVRCYSGSPLLPPEELEDFECEGCPPDYELPAACNGNCFTVVTTTTTTMPVTTTTLGVTTTRRPVTTTRRPPTTTRAPTTAPPMTTTQPPTTAPITTTLPATTSTGISEGTTTTTSTTDPPSEN
jgi:hypothetical protein